MNSKMTYIHTPLNRPPDVLPNAVAIQKATSLRALHARADALANALEDLMYAAVEHCDPALITDEIAAANKAVEAHRPSPPRPLLAYLD